MSKGGYVYIITNKNKTVLYTGVTSDLISRIWEHKNTVYLNSFSARYKLYYLMYYEYYECIEEAIETEKKIKGTSRLKKEALINRVNPEWKDLYGSLEL